MDKKTMNPTLKKIWDVASSVVVVIMVICALFLTGSRLLGYRVCNVTTGSMEPEYMVGDLIYVKATPFDKIKVGDVVTYVLNEEGTIATHRVVSINEQKQQLITKGDTNKVADAPVHYKNVVGVVAFSIPALGHVSGFIQTPPGAYVAIAVCVLLIVFTFLPDVIAKKKAGYNTVAESKNDEPATAVAAQTDGVAAAADGTSADGENGEAK